MITKLQEKYTKEALPAMIEKFKYKSPMAAPKIVKVVINTGFGKIVAGKTGEEAKKIAEGIVSDLSIISGQKAMLARSKKSIAGFKLREGLAIGAKVTLRGKRMYGFLDRLIHVVLPRTRDFRGLDAKTIDSTGNLTIGIKEHIFFPEIAPEKVRTMIGLEITVVTNAKSREEGKEVFSLLGFPLQEGK